jgi:hypothetical protein
MHDVTCHSCGRTARLDLDRDQRCEGCGKPIWEARAIRLRISAREAWLVDPCEYNPDERRAAYEHEVHARADVIVGAKGKWRLCRLCAALPEFRRLRKRRPIKGMCHEQR